MRRHTRSKNRIAELFASDEHVQLEATWGIDQRMITAYRDPDGAAGRALMVRLITLSFT